MHWQGGGRQAGSRSHCHLPFLSPGPTATLDPTHRDKGPTGFGKLTSLARPSKQRLTSHGGRIKPNNLCTFIQGVFTNILALESHSLSAGWHSHGRKWGREELGVSVESWITSAVPEQNLVCLFSDPESLFPYKSQSHIWGDRKDTQVGSTLKYLIFQFEALALHNNLHSLL